MTEYFESEKPRRFKFEKVIGVGAYGIAWRLIYRPRTSSGGVGKAQRLVMKMDRTHATSGLGEDGGAGQISDEGRYLSVRRSPKACGSQTHMLVDFAMG